METKQWFYLDNLGGQKGPIGEAVLLKLCSKGIGGISATTMLWQPGRPEWEPLHKIEPFASLVLFQMKQWYFVDDDNQQKGPISSRLLIHKLKEGHIDGMSMVFTTGMASWQRISEIEDLKDELRKIAEEEAATAAALSNVAESQANEQVFDPDALQDQEVKQAAEGYFAQSKQRHFVSDDGVGYRWDDEEQDWVVDDTVDDSQDHNDAPGGEEKGGSDNDMSSEEEAEQQPKADEQKKRKRRSKKKSKAPSTWIYITGLPPDVTAEELKAHFSKVGFIALSPFDQQSRIKIYYEEDDDTKCKGDATICYNAEASVQLAVDVLDGGYLRPNVRITVSKATFDSNNKGEESKARKKAKLSTAQIKVAKSAAKQALAWNEDDDIGVSKSSSLKIVVLENLFSPEELKDPQVEADLEKDVAEECEKCGAIEKITMFTKHPKGVIVVKYSTSFAAQKCIELMNGRFFGGRKVKSYYWDGVTNFSLLPAGQAMQKMAEEEKEEEARLDEFGDWLEQEQEELPEEFQLRTE